MSVNETELDRQLALLPEYLGNHLLLALAALATGIVICLPLAVLTTRVKPLQWPVLTFAAVMQTIPGIALLALMVPLLSRIGFLPAFIALVLYSMLPILRNAVTGILGVDRSLIEAARGIGMTDFQRLFAVELPLALPVIIAGIRTAAVWVVGTATLSTPVGATSLGNYIFGGLQTQNYTAVLVGCSAAAFLAILLDQLIRLMEVAASKRKRGLAISAALGLCALLVGGITPLMMKGSSEREILIGAKTFTEQYILAEVLAQKFSTAGINTSVKSGLGSTIVFDALAANRIDCYVDYSGTIWTNIMKRTDMPPRSVLLSEMKSWLQQRHGIAMAGSLGFENTYALALQRTRAAELNVVTMDDLARQSARLSIGSDYEFFSRPEWRALQQTYDLRFAELRTLDPSLMYAAIKASEVDVISAYSTDGRIVEYDLLVLADPKQALPPYDAVLLVSPRASGNHQVQSIVKTLVHAISNDMMRRANMMVDSDKKSVSEAASYILQQNPR